MDDGVVQLPRLILTTRYIGNLRVRLDLEVSTGSHVAGAVCTVHTFGALPGNENKTNLASFGSFSTAPFKKKNNKGHPEEVPSIYSYYGPYIPSEDL